MSVRGANGSEPAANELSRLLDELDRLEDLLEEMDDLGVSSRADIERRMGELNARVDEFPDDE